MRSKEKRNKKIRKIIGKRAIALFLSGLLMLSIPTVTDIYALSAVDDVSSTPSVASMNESENSGAMFRWWVVVGDPIDEENLFVYENELETIAANGYAGVEVSVLKSDGENLEENGWGTEAWTNFLLTVFRKADELGLKVDLTVTCGWPISLPEAYVINAEDDSVNYLEKNLYEGDYITVTKNGSDIIVENDEDYVLFSDAGIGYDVTTHEDPTSRRTLEGVTVAKIVGESTTEKGQQYYVWGSANIPGGNDDTTSVLLDKESLMALTDADYTLDEESASVTLNWVPEEDGTYRVFTYWLGFSGATSSKGTATTNYYVDYLNSETLVNAYSKFIEDTILANEELAALIEKNGCSLFDDSIEFGSYFGADRLEWSDVFKENFQNDIGYDITKYLPMLEGQSMGGSTNVEYYIYEFATFDEEKGSYVYDNSGETIRRDLSQEYTYSWERHINEMQEWAHEYNISYRAQEYSFNFDVAYLSAITDYPDTETVGFYDLVTTTGEKYEHGDDKNRLVASGAHMGDKNIISSECGAVNVRSYRMTWEKIMEYAQLQFALGTNRIIFHGFSSTLGGSAWPGYTGFDGLGDSWGPRNPSWFNGDDDQIAEFIANTQTILQAGDPVVDIAVYNDHYGSYSPIWTDDSLEYSGYSFDFISSNLLTLDSAYVEHSVLAPGNGSYKAMIFNNQTYMDIETAEKILDYVQNGFPILVIGDFPSVPSSYVNYDGDLETLENIIGQIMNSSSTYHVDDESEMISALEEAGIYPDANPEAAASEEHDLITAHRDTGSADYYYIYNNTAHTAYYEQEEDKIDEDGTIYSKLSVDGDDNQSTYVGETVTDVIALKGEGSVFEINLWTGEIRQLADYKEKSDGTYEVNISLDYNESVMYAVADSSSDFIGIQGSIEVSEMLDTVSVNSPSGSQVQTYAEGSDVLIQVMENGIYEIECVSGDSGTFEINDLPDTLDLSEGYENDKWTLSVESWTGDEDYNYKNSVKVLKDRLDAGESLTVDEQLIALNGTIRTSLDDIVLDTLDYWTNIDGIGAEISGIGTYSIDLELPDGWDNVDGAIINIKVMDNLLTSDNKGNENAKLIINGTEVIVNSIDFSADIQGLLHAGENAIEIQIDTTLGNALIANGAIAPTWAGSPEVSNNGIAGVTLIPYRFVVLGELEEDGINAEILPTTITDLTVDYQVEPYGVDTQDILFGWKLESGAIGTEQESYLIKVFDEEGARVWSSGYIEGDKSVAIPYVGPELDLETAYEWEVTVKDNYGRTIESERATFETGCDWGDTEWITSAGWTLFDGYIDHKTDPFQGVDYDEIELESVGGDAPLFRTEQALEGDNVVSARLYMTALGSYEAYINGEEVQNDVNSILAPGWTDYNERVTYQTYDVTDYIEGDSIVLSAIVGAGWYGSSMNTRSLYHYAIGGEPSPRERALYAKLVIDYADGTQQVIMTNDDTNADGEYYWSASDTLSPYTTTGIYEGEVYNGEMAHAIDGWMEPGYDVVTTSAAIVVTTDGGLVIDFDEYIDLDDEEITDLSFVSEQLEDWYGVVDLGAYAGDVEASSVSVGYDYETLDFVTAYVYNDDDIIPAEESDYPGGEIDFESADVYEPGETIQLNEGDTLVFDFGQNASGMPKLTVSGTAGTDLYMQPAEVVSDGYTSAGGSPTGPGMVAEPSYAAKGVAYAGAAEDRSFHYILSGEGQESYRAEMHFCGYRYLEVTATGGNVTIYNAQSVAVTSLSTETGFIETSNETLNQFISNTKWSQLSNFLTVMTDCPTREYRGWMGDAQLFVETAMFNFDSIAFTANYIDVMNDYFDINGTYSCLAPGSTDYSYQTSRVSAWSDAGIIMPYMYYLQTGDITMAEKYWDNMADFMNQIYSETVFDQDNFESGYKDYLQWGDHLALESASTDFQNLTFTLYDNMLMASMAEILGDTATAADYAEKAEFVREFMIERYVDVEGNINCYDVDITVIEGGSWDGSDLFDGGPMIGGDVVNNAQTALAWALKLGVYDTEAQKEHMTQMLVESIQNEDGSVREDYAENTLAVGFPGVNVLLPSVSEAGRGDVAYDLMMNTELYTPMYSAAVGGTTTWESWDGYVEGEGYDGNSKNHFSYGAPAEWAYEYLIGIQKDVETPGFKHFILQPEVDDSLSYANGSYESYYGTIVSNWAAEDGVLTSYEAEVPANTTADLYLPVDEDVVEADSIDGAEFVSFTEHNGFYTAHYELLSGGYEFALVDGTVTPSLASGYSMYDDEDSDSSSSHKSNNNTSSDEEVTPVDDITVIETETVKEFTDLQGYDWAADAITELASLGVIKGVSEDSYAPASKICRADFILLLTRALELNAEISGDFDDIEPGDYYYDAVCVAKEIGITNGMDGVNFEPKGDISRQDLMVMVHRALKLSGTITEDGSYEDIKNYADADAVADYALEAVASMVHNDLIKGDGTSLNPDGTATRAEVAVIMQRIMNKKEIANN